MGELPALLQGVRFAEGEKLRIMGVQDNYKPWSRKNFRNGKVVVIDPSSSSSSSCSSSSTAAEGAAAAGGAAAGGAAAGGAEGKTVKTVTQICFDDYSFTKSDAEGTYIYALYNADGTLIDGTKAELQARFSAEEAFSGKVRRVQKPFFVPIVYSNRYSSNIFEEAFSGKVRRCSKPFYTPISVPISTVLTNIGVYLLPSSSYSAGGEHSHDLHRRA